MSVLLLVLLLLLVAVNGFFVAAEFALVRSRRGKIEQLAEEGESGAETVVEQLDEIDESLSACQIGITMASIGIGFLGEPSLAKLLEPVFGGLSHGAAVGLSVGDRLRPRHRDPHQHRRAGAEDAGDQPGRADRAPRLAPAQLVPPRHDAADDGPERDLQLDRPPLRRRPDQHRREAHRRGPEADHRQLAAGRHARPGRGGDARRRLPPPRAGGARGDDADPGGGHRRLLGDRGDGAAALRHLGPHAAGRDRGRQPRSGQGNRPQQQPCPPLHERRARGADRAGRARGGDRPRDPPARRPSPRPAGAAHLALGDRRRVRPHGRDRHRRGHPRGGGGGDRGRDRPARRGAAPARRRRVVRARPRLARRPRRPRDRAAGRQRRLQLDRRLRLRRARAAAEARRHDRRQRLHDPGRVGAREPGRGGADQRHGDSVRPAA